MSETELHLLTRGITEFTKCLYSRNQSFTNNTFAPINIHAFLALLSQDLWFQTKQLFNNALQLDANVAAAHYKDMFAALDTLRDFQIDNIAFLRPLSVIEDNFKNRLKDDFFSKISFLNFAEKEGASETINAWVGNATNQKIKNFSDIKDDTNLIDLNATYFENNWADPFAATDTVLAEFFSNGDAKINVQMMRKKGEFYYKKDGFTGVKVLKLPFADSDISLIVILPENTTNVYQHYYDLKQLTTGMIKQVVDVSLPKFKMNQVSLLADPLKKMGLEEVFSASLLGMIEGEVLSLNEIQQNVFLDVNEGGLEAATGTSSILTKVADEMIPSHGLIVYEANITTEISNRFAKTKVIWRVNNSDTKASDAEFKVILTETAFITEFVMEIDGKSYESYIKEKEEAKGIYNTALAHGQSAGLVEAKTRDSREFTVKVNLEPDSVAVFSLTYEEMLQRVHDQYELVLNICPGQIVADLNIEVRINESQPLKFVKTPPLRTGTDIRSTDLDKYLDPQSNIKMINSKTATIKFHPDVATQKKMTYYLKSKSSKGLTGQFVVQYDVERDPCNGEVLLQDGYFVHFFAPNDLDPLPKHVIFVLDTSGSMMGRKIEQLKDAMMNILGDLREEDMFSIIEFNSDVIVWDVNLKKYTLLTANSIRDFKEPFASLQRLILAGPQRVSDSIIKKAKEVVQDVAVGGSTFMIGGLETALYLVKAGQEMNEGKDEKKQPIILFLTDGQPNVGLNSTEQIVEIVSQLNTKDQVPIFSLSFGDQADKNFLRKLSQKNFGFSRYIYEAADASLQLQDFYKRISSPLLCNIKFKYDAEVEEVTRTWFPIFFRGSELIVSGRYGGSTFPTNIDCWGPHGSIFVSSVTKKPVSSLERMWAYLTVKQLLDERDSALNPAEITRKATELALKYSFVTDVTSLVVVKPKDTNAVLDNRPDNIPNQPMFGSAQGPQPTLRRVAQPMFRRTDGTQPMFGSAQAAQSMFRSAHAPRSMLVHQASVFKSARGEASVFGSTAFTQGGASGFGSTASTQGGASGFGSTVFGQGGASGFGSTASTQGGAFGFGSTASTQGEASAIGSTAFGQVGASGFGSTAFGQSGAVSGLFGAAPTQPSSGSFQCIQPLPNVFPQAGTSASLFGSATSAVAPCGTSSSTSGTLEHTEGTSSFSGVQVGKSTDEDPFLALLNGVPSATHMKLKKMEVDSEGKQIEEFTANRPFFIMLQLEKDGAFLLLLHGYVQQPNY